MLTDCINSVLAAFLKAAHLFIHSVQSLSTLTSPHLPCNSLAPPWGFSCYSALNWPIKAVNYTVSSHHLVFLVELVAAIKGKTKTSAPWASSDPGVRITDLQSLTREETVKGKHILWHYCLTIWSVLAKAVSHGWVGLVHQHQLDPSHMRWFVRSKKKKMNFYLVSWLVAKVLDCDLDGWWFKP